jgi:hypothetical protein
LTIDILELPIEADPICIEDSTIFSDHGILYQAIEFQKKLRDSVVINIRIIYFILFIFLE